MDARQKRRLIRKVVKTVLAVLGFVGFFILLGSAGALEQDVITIRVYWKQALLGLALLGTAVHTYNYLFENRRSNNEPRN